MAHVGDEHIFRGMMQTSTSLRVLNAAAGNPKAESQLNSARNHPANPFQDGNLVSKFTLQIIGT